MSGPQVTLLIVAMALVTLTERASFLILKDRLRLPKLVERALAYVPAAVIAALVAPLVFTPGGESFTAFDVRPLAAAAAAAVAWFTRSVLGTLAVGMGTLWTLSWLLG